MAFSSSCWMESLNLVHLSGLSSISPKRSYREFLRVCYRMRNAIRLTGCTRHQWLNIESLKKQVWYLAPDQLLARKDRLWIILYEVPGDCLKYCTRLLATKEHRCQWANLVSSPGGHQNSECSSQRVIKPKLRATGAKFCVGTTILQDASSS